MLLFLVQPTCSTTDYGSCQTPFVHFISTIPMMTIFIDPLSYHYLPVIITCDHIDLISILIISDLASIISVVRSIVQTTTGARSFTLFNMIVRTFVLFMYIR
ncbi:unnamed protein product [Calicophoron daubneyi]|uniref:Uncharacterized protein n=1 Tax=Calicophoron daubneyi TaxID=300641 RepID=A0AAV2T6E1_CALDB